MLFDDGTVLSEKYIWHKIDGRNYHWNKPHEGLKYGIVLYKQKAKHTKQEQMVMARQKRQQAEQEPKTENSD